MKRDEDVIDRRRFADLVAEASALIRRNCPAWTDLSPGDPGMTLVEVYAWMTETMLYRLNRLPARMHAELLGLLGVSPLPPAAAGVMLEFTRAADLPMPALTLPVGTQVSDPGGSVTFALTAPLVMAEGAPRADAPALHATPVTAELIGRGNGDGGQSFVLRRAPVLRALPDTEVLRIGVELLPGADATGQTTITAGDKVFALWSEATGFSARAGAQICVADRSSGRITFAPASGTTRGAGMTAGGAMLAQVPPEGAEIRAWYLTGGGRAGNVAPGTLTSLRTPVPGLAVTNPARATGGEDGETPEAFLTRAQSDIRNLECAVTAADFEQVALNAGGVSRASAGAQRDRWVFGTPGLVEVLIVPAVTPDPATGAVTTAALAEHQTPQLRDRVAGALDAHRPIGVRTDVRWGQCRAVSVAGRVAVAPTEDPGAMQTRIIRRLNRLLSPAGGWRFGRGLRVSDVYDAILDEPGVRYAERITLTTDAGPAGEVRALLADPHQPRCLYALLPDGPWRSMDNGASWELLLPTAPQHPVAICADPATPGFVALVAGDTDARTQLWTSGDCGESWQSPEVIEHAVHDLACVRRDNRDWILLATEKGLFRTDRAGPRGLLALPLAPEAPAGGCYGVASGTNPAGMSFVAVAARAKGGIWLSAAAGVPGSFRLLPGSQGQDIRRLAFRRDGGQLWLWAGLLAEAGQTGRGMMRIAVREDGLDPSGWQELSQGWRGGSCLGFDISEGRIAAATRDAGVLVIDDIGRDPVWRAPVLSAGLPIDDSRERLLPVQAVALAPGGAQGLVAGGPRGLFTGETARLTFRPAGGRVFGDEVPLPARWLFCAGAHEIGVFADLQDRPAPPPDVTPDTPAPTPDTDTGGPDET